LYEATRPVVININMERRHMSRFDSSLARTLDFGESTSHRPIRGLISLRTSQRHQGLVGRRLGLLRGPDRYRVLDRRRRAAQIKARHAMDLIDVMERSAERR
jgi:hypothetical protein